MPTYLDRSIRPELDALRFSNRTSEDIAGLDWEQQSLDDIGRLGDAPRPPGIDAGVPARAASDAPVFEAPAPLSLGVPRRAADAPPDWRPLNDQIVEQARQMNQARNGAAPAPSGAPAPRSAPQAPLGQPQAMPSGGDADPSTVARIANAGTRASRYAEPIARIAAEEGVPAEGLAALVDTEDSGEDSTSVDGARGLLQVVGGQGFDMPGENASDPETSIRQGARAYREKIRMAGGDPQRAGGLYFGVGADSNGVTSDVYQQRFDANHARYGASPTAPPAAAPSSTPSAGGAPDGSWEVDQAALDDPDKWSLCGPVAAVMAATKRGANWTVGQAKQIAVASGLWDADQGMHGLQTEVGLLNRMGVSATTGPADAQRLAADALAGNTPIISTAKHYFILKGYDPETGRFDTTTSGSVLRGGSRYLTLDQIEKLGGGIQGAAYIDNPSSPVSSVAAGDSQKTGADVPDTGMSAGDQKRAKMAGQQDDMLRQPLAPTMGADTGQGDEPPFDPDQGPHESGYSMPPTQYGAGQDDPGQPTPASPYTYLPPTAPLASDQGAMTEASVRSRPQMVASDQPMESDQGQMQEMSAARPGQAAAYGGGQDDPGAVQAGPQIVQAGMPSIPFKDGFTPILDAAHRVIAWIQDAAASDENPSPEEQAQRASVAGRNPDEHLFEPARVVAGTAPAVQSTLGEPDYVPPGPRSPLDLAEENSGYNASVRLRQIEGNAARELGITDPVRAMQAPNDPRWRANNPTTAEEYDGLLTQLANVVGGTFGSMHEAPEPRYRPELTQEPVLPGFEPPRKPIPLPESVGDAAAQAEMRAGGNALPGLEQEAADRFLPVRDASVSGDAAVAQGEMRSGGSALPGLEEQAADRFAPVRGRVPGATRPEAVKARTEMRAGGDAIPGMESLAADRFPRIRASVPGATTAEAAQAGSEMRAAGSAMLPTLQEHRGVLQRVSDAVAPWANRVNIVRYSGMLSDSATHAMNVTGNAIMQAGDVATTPIAAGIDVLRSSVTGAPRQVFFTEVPARLAGMRAGASTGLQAAWDVMRTGVHPDDAAKLDHAATGFNSGSKVADFAFEAPLRGLAAADAVFRSMAQGGHMAAEATAAAMKANGGRAVTPEMIREAMKNPDLVDRVGKLAARSVLQEDRGLTQGYQELLRRAGPVARAAASVEIPFVKTPYNSVAQGLGMTPAGLAGVIQDMAEGRAARDIEHRVARVALGTAVMAGAAADYGAGNLTGPYPTDPKEASTLPPGWKPWSRKVTLPGGSVYYVPLAVLGPYAVPAVTAILAGESIKRGKSALSPEWAGAVALGIGQYAEQQTFFEGFANIAKTFENPDRKIQQNVEQIAAQFSPHVIGGGALGREVQRIIGMPARDPEGAMEALLATHPLTADRVAPKQDVLGRPQSMGVGGSLGAIVRASPQGDAAVIRAFRAAKEGLPMAAPKSIRDESTNELRTLSSPQQHRWRRVFGAALRESWDNNGNPNDAETLRRVESEARTTANQSILGLR